MKISLRLLFVIAALAGLQEDPPWSPVEDFSTKKRERDKGMTGTNVLSQGLFRGAFSRSQAVEANWRCPKQRKREARGIESGSGSKYRGSKALGC